MKKVPTIVLSVSYKGVKFIDATNKVCVYTKTEQSSHGRVAFHHTLNVIMRGTGFLKLIFDYLSVFPTLLISTTEKKQKWQYPCIMGNLFYCTSKYKELKVKYMLKFVITQVAERRTAA